MNHLFGLFVSPAKEWESIRMGSKSVVSHYLSFIIWVAAIAPAAWYYGSTQIGWQ